MRSVLTASRDSLLCVAFAHERGVRLLGKELEYARRRGGRARLLVTNVFDRGGSTSNALAAAVGYDVEVRIHNHAGGTYHPKLYLGADGKASQAVIGSANLTAGLACNIEVGVALTGTRRDEALARAWEIGEELWSHARSEEWRGQIIAPLEGIEPELFSALQSACEENPVFLTLGRDPKPNHVVELNSSGALVETVATDRKNTSAQLVPAWMLNIAWDYLRAKGALSNSTLLNDLRVHRSSAVCAMLGRVPGVRVTSAKPVVLAWVPGAVTRQDFELVPLPMAAEGRRRSKRDE